MTPPPIAKVLPMDAALILVKASATPQYDPHARITAIDQAAARVRKMYPNLFRKEQHE